MVGHGARKSEWLIAALTTLLCLAVAALPGAARLEGALLAWASSFTVPSAASDKVVIVSLDPAAAPALRQRLVERLEAAKAVGVVGDALSLDGAFHALTVRVDSARRGAPALAPAVTAWGPGERPRRLLAERLPSLVSGDPPVAAWMAPAPAGAAAPAGFPGDASGRGYRVPLLWRYGEQWLPTFSLRLAAAALDAELTPRALGAGGVTLGERQLAVDRAYRAYPRLLDSRVATHGADEVAAGELPLAGRVVLVGDVSAQAAEPVLLADGTRLAPVEAEARAVAALLDGALYRVPAWAIGAHVAAFVLAGLLLGLVMPRLHPSGGSILVVLFLVVSLTAEFGSAVLQAAFLPLLFPALVLVAGTPLVWWRRRRIRQLAALRRELATTNRLLAEAYHAQGQLDAAYERYRRSDPDERGLERLYDLGMDFERRRQFAKASAVFERVCESAPEFRDAALRLQRNREADRRVTLGKPGPTTASGTLILDNSGLARPTIGRYEVEREIGRGAMGLVYLGRDPKIGRTVAIKTMALSEEFEGHELDGVRERFFREAETAGRLDHPNIVTIYDVGEEQELAYIAMDYLRGESLARYCRPENLLPFDEVMAVAIQVAEALDYAHAQGVIHRDIKPANIVYDRADGALKVTDFGVACLTDSSKTRTGTVLGSPSYMSPEQVAGYKVDGRSDLFSLGVTLFQLLTGELPFKADSLASLMYQIANERPADLHRYRDGLPTCIGRLINKALHKEPGRRYQSGMRMADSLRRCRRLALEAQAA